MKSIVLFNFGCLCCVNIARAYYTICAVAYECRCTSVLGLFLRKCHHYTAEKKREGRRLLAKSIFKVLGYSGEQRSQYVMILRLCFGMEALQSRRPSGPLWRVSWCLLKSIFDAELTGIPVEVCFLASEITLTDRNDTELRFCDYVSYSYRSLNALNLLYQIDIDYILRFKLRAQI